MALGRETVHPSFSGPSLSAKIITGSSSEYTQSKRSTTVKAPFPPLEKKSGPRPDVTPPGNHPGHPTDNQDPQRKMISSRSSRMAHPDRQKAYRPDDQK